MQITDTPPSTFNLLRIQTGIVDTKAATLAEMESKLRAYSMKPATEEVNIEFNGKKRKFERCVDYNYETHETKDGGLKEDTVKVYSPARIELGAVVMDNAIIYERAHVRSGEVIKGNQHVHEEMDWGMPLIV